ncbi:MAG: FAD-dependent oxidoreductase [Candidatus Altiarchaeota archaeon]|nr:FAD-dependent oxidoreductase [Candidatus Altiarchaeota archaeon]
MFDVLIIGAGIAGQTAAIYAARKQMNYLLVADEMGGQFLESGEILNYPGIIETTGAELKKILEEQLGYNSIKPMEGVKITRLEEIKEGFRAYADGGVEYEARTVVIASGARPRKLGVPGEKKYLKKGVTYCSICDGPLFNGVDVAVVGGGNSALEAVDFMKDIAKKIYLINNAAEFNAHEYLIENITALDNVEIINEANTRQILGEKMVSGLRYELDGKIQEIKVNGIIIEIGRTPNTDFLKGFVELNNKGSVVIDCQARTSKKGVYAAGDCTSGGEYQYVIAAGQGCIALLKAARYLARRR